MGQTYGAKVRCRGVIHHEGKVLVVRQHGASDRVCLPGGTLEQGETPRETIARELEEELGIVPVLGEVQAILTFDLSRDRRRIEYIFCIENGSDYRDRDERGSASHGHEIAELLWRPIADLGDDFVPRTLVNMENILESDGVFYGEVNT